MTSLVRVTRPTEHLTESKEPQADVGATRKFRLDLDSRLRSCMVESPSRSGKMSPCACPIAPSMRASSSSPRYGNPPARARPRPPGPRRTHLLARLAFGRDPRRARRSGGRSTYAAEALGGGIMRASDCGRATIMRSRSWASWPCRADGSRLRPTKTASTWTRHVVLASLPH